MIHKRPSHQPDQMTVVPLASHGRGGFTLIELLTSIAIISVLISILLPSLSAARRQGKVTKCLANVRGLSEAALRYVDQNEGVFPVSWLGDETTQTFWNGHQYWGWNGRVATASGQIWPRYVNRELGLELAPPNEGDAKITECPSDAGAPGQSGTEDPLFVALGTSYPLNPILTQGRYADWHYRSTDLGLSQVIQPSRQVLTADHTAFGLTFDANWTAVRPGWHDPVRPASVVGFVDGHAEYVKGLCTLREWQWYPDATGPEYVNNLSDKVDWTVYPQCN